MLIIEIMNYTPQKHGTIRTVKLNIQMPQAWILVSPTIGKNGIEKKKEIVNYSM